MLTRQSRTLRNKISALSTTKRTWSNKVCCRSLPRLRYVFFVPVSSGSSLHFYLPSSSSHFDLRHLLLRCVPCETAAPRRYQAWVAFSGASFAGAGYPPTVLFCQLSCRRVCPSFHPIPCKTLVRFCKMLVLMTPSSFGAVWVSGIIALVSATSLGTT